MKNTHNDIFGDLYVERFDYDRSKFVIIPVPYEKSTSYGKGTAQAPQAIIEASHNLEMYDEIRDSMPFEAGICILDKHFEMSDTARFFEELSSVVKSLERDGKIPILLGGEHTITYPVIEGIANRYSDISILQIDAHPDLREEFEGNPFSHACAMNLCKEYADIVGVGIRAVGLEERHFINNGNVHTFFAHQIKHSAEWIEDVVASLKQSVYVTIDVDGFDPSVFPDTGTPEPGGLGWYDVIDLLTEVTQKRNVLGFDVVELIPGKGSVISDFTAAKLIYRFIGMIAQSRGLC